MGREVKIRSMREEDLRDVFLLGNELFGQSRKGAAFDQWSERALAPLLAANLAHSLVALRGRGIAGFIIPEVEGDGTALIRWIAWREGDEIAVAAPLLEAFQALSSEKNLTRVRIMIGSGNHRLIELCRKFGFTESNHVLIMENFFPKLEQ